MSERIRGIYDDALYKLTYTLLYFTLIKIKFSTDFVSAGTLFNRKVPRIQLMPVTNKMLQKCHSHYSPPNDIKRIVSFTTLN